MSRRAPFTLLRGPVRAALLLACGIAACGEEGPTIPADPLETAVLEVVEGDTRGVVAQQPEVQPSVRVTTPDGLPLQDVEVSWTPGEGDGTAAEATVTDAGGVAVAAWTLGERADTQRITARIENGAQVTVEAVAEAGAVSSLDGPDVVFVEVGMSTPVPIALRDDFGNEIPPSRVTWSVAATDLATVNDLGVLTGIAQGRTELTVEVDGATATFPLQVSPPLRLERLFVGNSHACGLRVDGEAFCWGNNNLGQLGTGHRDKVDGAVRVLSPEPLAYMSLGDLKSCALSVTDNAYCWGDRSHALLGDSVGFPELHQPTQIAVEGPFRWIETGIHDTHCAVLHAGDALCWGHDDRGQVGDGQRVGTVYWPKPLAVDEPILEIRLSIFHGCALAESGKAWCWGQGADVGRGLISEDQTPAPVAGDEVFTELVRGFSGTCGLTADRSAYCWGGESYMTILRPGEDFRVPTLLTDARFRQLAIGEHGACGILLEGDAVCWSGGDPEFRPLEVPGVREIGVGWFFSCALDTDGAPWCWRSDYGPTPRRIFLNEP